MRTFRPLNKSDENEARPLTPQPARVHTLHLVSSGYNYQVFHPFCWQGLPLCRQKQALGVRASPFLSWLTSSATKALLPRPMWLMSSQPTAKVHFKHFTSTRPPWTIRLFLLVFSLLFLEFMLFSLFRDYFCFRLARFVWAPCPDQYT